MHDEDDDDDSLSAPLTNRRMVERKPNTEQSAIKNVNGPLKGGQSQKSCKFSLYGIFLLIFSQQFVETFVDTHEEEAETKRR